jgi:hypothetical protein
LAKKEHSLEPGKIERLGKWRKIHRSHIFDPELSLSSLIKECGKQANNASVIPSWAQSGMKRKGK